MSIQHVDMLIPISLGSGSSFTLVSFNLSATVPAKLCKMTWAGCLVLAVAHPKPFFSGIARDMYAQEAVLQEL